MDKALSVKHPLSARHEPAEVLMPRVEKAAQFAAPTVYLEIRVSRKPADGGRISSSVALRFGFLRHSKKKRRRVDNRNGTGIEHLAVQSGA